MNTNGEISKAAAENRRLVEADLDKLAKYLRQDGETFEAAYVRVLETELGKSMMRTRDDAQELERGGVTSMELEAAQKQLLRQPH